MGAVRGAYALLLILLELVFTLLGWVGGADEGALAVVLRWSAPVGVLLLLAVLSAGGARSLVALRVLVTLAALRVVVVVVVLLLVGSDDPNGRADPSYLLTVAFGTLVALADLIVAASVLRALRPGRRARR